jgi:MFS family permease
VSPQTARRSLAVLFLVNVLNFYDRQALGAVLEPLRHEFLLSDTQLGGLTALFTVVYAIAGLPLGRLADTSSRRRLLAVGVAVWSGLTGLGGLASSYAMLLATRLGVGIGEAVCAPAATSWIGDLVPPARRARAMAGFMMAVPIGGLLSFAVTGPLAQAYGWRAALAAASLPAIALIPALLWLHEPERGSGAGVQTTGNALVLLRIPALWWIALSGAVANFALYSFSTFVAAFLTRFHGLSVAQSGLWTGIGAGGAGILGAIAAGALGDSAMGRRGRSRMLLASGASLLAAPLLSAAILLPAGNAAAVIALLMAAYGLLQMYYGLVYAAMHDIVPASLRGAAMALYFVVTYLCGASFGPLLTGMLSDRFARLAAHGALITEAAKATGLHQAMFVIPVLALLLSGVLWTGARAMRGELAQ